MRLPALDGALFTVAGLAAFWHALGYARPPDVMPVAEWPRAPGLSLRAAGFGLVALVLGALAVLAVFAGGRLPPPQALVLGAAGCWLLAAWLLGSKGPASPDGQARAPVLHAWLLFILVVAAAVRLVFLDGLPAGLWYDEAGIGLEGRRILEDPNYRPMYAPSTTSPAYFVYLVAGAEALFGQTPAAVRAVPALMGTATAGLASFAGGLLWGRWGAIAAGLLFALARWDINFSRIGMQGESTPLFVMAALVLALLAVRTGRPLPYAALGLVLGGSLWFYGADVFFFAVPVAGLLIIALQRKGFIKQHWTGLALAGAGVALVAAPVVADGSARPGVVFSRAEVVSVFREKTLAQALPIVEESLGKHLAMFHLSGDRNGRHNLPGAPMLDGVTGGLMLLGLTAAVFYLHDPAMVILLVWLPVMLLPGVLSLPFEAPQGLRAIGALPAALLLAALGVYHLRRLIAPRLGSRGFGVLAALGIAIVAFSNLDTYFRVQASDPDVWSAFSMAPTEVGRRIATAPNDRRALVSVFYQTYPSIQFLTSRPFTVLDASRHLPLDEERDTDIFLAPEEEQIYRLVRTYYGSATCDEVRNRPASPPVLYACSVSADLVRASHGIEGGRGSLQAPAYGPYRLQLQGAGSWSLDGQQMPPVAEVLLSEGLHEVTLSGAMLWQPPGEGLAPVPRERLYHGDVRPLGLLATYYRGQGWGGIPAFQRLEPGPFTYFQELPLEVPFSVEWAGEIFAPVAGPYGFSVESISQASVELDGRSLVVNTQPGITNEGTATLTAGWHAVRVRHFAGAGYAHVYVRWRPPGGTMDLVPPERMRPWPSP